MRPIRLLKRNTRTTNERERELKCCVEALHEFEEMSGIVSDSFISKEVKGEYLLHRQWRQALDDDHRWSQSR
jgi:hypothetical protein